jgi:hypothetical protein
VSIRRFSSLLSMATLALAILGSCTVGPTADRSIWESVGVTFSWGPVGLPDFGATGINTPMIAFDSSNTPYVAYRDWSAGPGLTVHRYDGTQWVQVGVGSVSGADIDNPNIVLGPDGLPIVAYKNQATGDAEVKRFDGFSWGYLGPPGSISTGDADYVRLAIYKDKLFCAYADASQGGRLTVRGFNTTAGTWFDQGGTAGFSPAGVWNVDLAVDHQGNPWAAFNDTNGGGNYPSVERWNGGGWDYQQFAMGTMTFQTHSLAVDPAGVMWFAGHDDSIGGARALKYLNGTWATVGAPGFSAGGVWDAALAFGPGGVPYLAYRDGAFADRATMVTYTGSAWVTVGVAGFTAGTAMQLSLAVDSQGRAFMVYQDALNGNGATALAYR